MNRINNAITRLFRRNKHSTPEIELGNLHHSSSIATTVENPKYISPVHYPTTPSPKKTAKRHRAKNNNTRKHSPNSNARRAIQKAERALEKAKVALAKAVKKNAKLTKNHHHHKLVFTREENGVAKPKRCPNGSRRNKHTGNCERV